MLRQKPNVHTIPPGVPFLPTLVDALLSGKLVEGFHYDGSPLSLSDVTIYLPTRRAVRALRSAFLDRLGGRSAILPVIRALGEFESDLADFDPTGSQAALDLAPPMSHLDRILLLGPLVQAWKARVPAHVAERFAEGVVVPATLADGLWLARDLANLMDEIENEQADWSRLSDLVPRELAGWWQVTLDFLSIVTSHWPNVLAAYDRSNPAAHRNAMLDAEAERLREGRHQGPVIAAGSTGSIPATARLLGVIARLPDGAVVLPGFDTALDDKSWASLDAATSPASCGHPQFGLKKLVTSIRMQKQDIAVLAEPSPALEARRRLMAEAMRPADTTDLWAELRPFIARTLADGALDGVSLIEAASQREEAFAIAVALRDAIATQGRTAALVTPDRTLARRVAAELRRFGIEADDSAGTPLSETPPATLLRLLLEASMRPGDPIPIISLLKHPLLHLSLPRSKTRHAVEWVELVALRGGTGRPDIASLDQLFEERLEMWAAAPRKPFWMERFSEADAKAARDVLKRLVEAVGPLAALRGSHLALSEIARTSVEALEALGCSQDGKLDAIYGGDAGEALASFLSKLVSTEAPLELQADEWPDVYGALSAGQGVKPSPGADQRVSIWGTLEARLQHVDVMVLGGLNEGSWPQVAASDRFLSRVMKSDLALEPPERRIGLSAHDFMMAMGAPEVILSRASRAGEAPAVASRWLQRLTACIGEEAANELRHRGERFIAWTHHLEAAGREPFVKRPEPKPPIEARPTHFSVTEVETLRRDPYAIYARRILGLYPLDPLIRDPGAAERGNLFHDILEHFIATSRDPAGPEALGELLQAGRDLFAEAALPADVEAVWWPRFERTAGEFIRWESERARHVAARHVEVVAGKVVVQGEKTLSGRADRIDIRTDGSAEIIDYKTGSYPSTTQAYRLLAPQLPLEAALLARGAFFELGAPEAEDLLYVRLKAKGEVKGDSVLSVKGADKTAAALAEESWQHLQRLLAYYDNPDHGYLSRALPFKESDTEGYYDHLARVLEWSAGGDDANGDGGV